MPTDDQDICEANKYTRLADAGNALEFTIQIRRIEDLISPAIDNKVAVVRDKRLTTLLAQMGGPAAYSSETLCELRMPEWNYLDGQIPFAESLNELCFIDKVNPSLGIDG